MRVYKTLNELNIISPKLSPYTEKDIYKMINTFTFIRKNIRGKSDKRFEEKLKELGHKKINKYEYIKENLDIMKSIENENDYIKHILSFTFKYADMFYKCYM